MSSWEIYVIKNSQPIVRMAIGLRGLERKSPIIGSQASLQSANILFRLIVTHNGHDGLLTKTRFAHKKDKNMRPVAINIDKIIYYLPFTKYEVLFTMYDLPF